MFLSNLVLHHVPCFNDSICGCILFKNELHHPVQTNEENTSLNKKIFGLQRKWSDICQRLHQNRSLPEFDITKARFQATSHEGFQFGPGSSSKGPLHSEI